MSGLSLVYQSKLWTLGASTVDCAIANCGLKNGKCGLNCGLPMLAN